MAVTLQSNNTMSSYALREIQNGLRNLASSSLSVELTSADRGTRITIVGDAGKVAGMLPGICAECTKKYRQGCCTHMLPGASLAGPVHQFTLVHCKLSEVPIPISSRSSQSSDRDDTDRWLFDQLVKVLLSPGMSGDGWV